MSIVDLRFNTKTLHTQALKTYTHTRKKRLTHLFFNVGQNALTGFKDVFTQAVTLIKKSFPGKYSPELMRGEY